MDMLAKEPLILYFVTVEDSQFAIGVHDASKFNKESGPVKARKRAFDTMEPDAIAECKPPLQSRPFPFLQCHRD